MSYNNPSVYKLIQPNLLSKEDLISHLQHRCIKIDNMGAMSKEQLVDLYSRVVTPLEQRITRRTPQVSTSSQENISMDCMELTHENLSKRIKLVYNNSNENLVYNHNHINLKRKANNIKVFSDVTPTKKVRQRICWP